MKFIKHIIKNPFFFILILGINAQSQEKDYKPGNSFSLVVGLEYRITPVNLKQEEYWATVPVYTNRDDQLTGPALNLGLLYFFNKPRVSFSVSGSLRHDLIYHQYGDLMNPTEDIEGIISDVHLDISKLFPLKKNFFQIGMGYSWMNFGTDFYYKQSLPVSGGDSKTNFRLDAFNLTLGYRVNQFGFDLINRFTSQHKYNEKGNVYLPAVRVSYGIQFNKRKII